jgi:PKD repeat protein
MQSLASNCVARWVIVCDSNVVQGKPDGSFVVDLSHNPGFVGTLTATYVVRTSVGESNQGIVQIAVTRPANRAPEARFRLTGSGQSVVNTVSLAVSAAAVNNEAIIVFTDMSSDPDGDDIVSWVWGVHTQSSPLCSGAPTCTWTFLPGGPYVVSLTVKDDNGLSSTATGSIVVHPPDPVVAGIAPTSIVASPTDQSITVTGLAFRPGLTVTVGLPGGGTSQLSGAQIPSVSPTSIQLLVTFADPGPYTFTVNHADGTHSKAFQMMVGSSSGQLVLTPSQILRMSFSVNPAGCPSQPDVLIVYPGPGAHGTATSTITLYDGLRQLGSVMGDGGQTVFFGSQDSGFGWWPSTLVDFSTVRSGSISGRVDFTIDTGTVTFVEPRLILADFLVAQNATLSCGTVTWTAMLVPREPAEPVGQVSIAVSPTAGDQISTTFNISGSNFLPGGEVRVLVRGADSLYRALPSANANSAGSIIATRTFGCNIAAGGVQVVAVDMATWIPGDLNADGIVNSVDFSILNTKWFTDDALADLNRDGIVNSIDASIMNSLNWLRTGPAGRVSQPVAVQLTGTSACSVSQNPAEFRGLGDSPGGAARSIATNVSTDGSTVVGTHVTNDSQGISMDRRSEYDSD